MEKFVVKNGQVWRGLSPVWALDLLILLTWTRVDLALGTISM